MLSFARPMAFWSWGGEPPDSGESFKNFCLNIHTKKMPLDKDVDLNKIAEETEGYTGADLESLAREAAMLALRDDLEVKTVKKKYFEKAMEKIVFSRNVFCIRFRKLVS